MKKGTNFFSTYFCLFQHETNNQQEANKQANQTSPGKERPCYIERETMLHRKGKQQTNVRSKHAHAEFATLAICVRAQDF